MNKVSILVAVYNAAPFLQKCLSSLTAQTYRNIEIICVDDASTDDSLAVLQRIATTDGRLKVVSLKENAGASNARKIAFQHASGEWVCMVDADDWLAEDAIALAMEQITEGNDTDAVLFDLRMVFPNREETFPMKPFREIGGSEAFRLALTFQIHGLYLLRSSIQRAYNYGEYAGIYSDEIITRIHYLHSRQVRCCGGRYYYRQHEQSTTHIVGVQRFDMLKVIEYLKRIVAENGMDETTIEETENYCWLRFIDCFAFYLQNKSRFSTAQRTGIMQDLRKTFHEIDKRKITSRKFGYAPLGGFRLYGWQLECYLFLRNIAYAMRKG